MADSQDPLHERTRRLLSDYIFFCAREPDTPEPPPTSVEAALLRSVTRQIQQEHQEFFSSFCESRGNRLELVKQMADKLLSKDQDFSWSQLVMLLAFAGTLMNQGPYMAVKQKRDLGNRVIVTRDCCLIVNFLYNLLMGRRHRARLEALGGWVRPLEEGDGDGLGDGAQEDVLSAFTAGSYVASLGWPQTSPDTTLPLWSSCFYPMSTRITGYVIMDGFCRFFKNPLPLGFWRRLLIQAFLSGFFATAIFFIWKRL